MMMLLLLMLLTVVRQSVTVAAVAKVLQYRLIENDFIIVINTVVVAVVFIGHALWTY